MFVGQTWPRGAAQLIAGVQAYFFKSLNRRCLVSRPGFVVGDASPRHDRVLFFNCNYSPDFKIVAAIFVILLLWVRCVSKKEK